MPGGGSNARLGVLDSVFEFRIANETAAASLAAVRRTSQQLKRLERAFNEMTVLCSTPALREQTANIARFSAFDSEFHLTIAQASMNSFIVKAVEDARAAMFLPIGKVFTRLEDNANDHHETLLDAIKNREPERAASEMRAHIEATRARLHALLPKSQKTRQPG